jgi:hypothetical protein
MVDHGPALNQGNSGEAAGGKRHDRLVWSVLTWGLVSGAGSVLLLALVFFLYGWLIGAEAINFTHNSPRSAPLSLEAACNALVGDVFILVLFGPPLFILAAIVGGSVAIVRKPRRRNQ